VLADNGKVDSSDRVKLTRPAPDLTSNVEFDKKDPFTGLPAPPSGVKSNFKTNKDAKQFLEQLGPELTEQLVATAGYLNEATPEAGVAAFQALLSQSDELVRPGQCVQGSCSSAAHSLRVPQAAVLVGRHLPHS
jgi:hypothetical protein